MRKLLKIKKLKIDFANFRLRLIMCIKRCKTEKWKSRFIDPKTKKTPLVNEELLLIFIGQFYVYVPRSDLTHQK